MRYLIHPDAGSNELGISGDDYKYIIKVRRHSVGDLIALRSRRDLAEEFRYRLERIENKTAWFVLESRLHMPCEAERKLHIGWCLVDPKTVEKTLPMLCELGVEKITFIRCRRSQSNFRIDYERLERIMESSIMQSGRTSLIEFDEAAGIGVFLQKYPDSAIMDFGGEPLKKTEFFDTIIVGCEGGFDEGERKLFAGRTLRQFASPMVMRSETAVVAVSSLMLG